jgi:carboxyl-terminal processing protease
MPPLEPTAQMRTETLYVVRCLSGIHYARRPISQMANGDIIDAYVDGLDPQRIFLLQKDVSDIHSRYDLTLDIFLNSGNAKPGFAIYDLFRSRASERLERIDAILSSPGEIIFPCDSYEPDRKETSRATCDDELEEIWSKLIAFDLLNEALQVNGESESCPEQPSIDWEAAKAKLRKRYGRYRDSICDIEPYHVQEFFLNGVAGTYDPHSSFMAAPTWEDFQSSSLTNSFMGIGAVLQDDDGYCKIIEIYAGSPAERSNALHVGDKILAVQQGDGEPVDIIGMRLNRAVKLIKGPKGTAVTLHLQPADGDPSERKIVTLIRDEIQLTFQRARARVYELPVAPKKSAKIGYIRLPAFYGGDGSEKNGSCCDDVEELLKKLAEEGIGGLAIDLRGNSGGLLDETIAIAGLFLDGGPIVQVRDGEGHSHLFADSGRKIYYGGPLLIMTSKQSASAAEILAGALQDHRRALIVGDQTTYGKGTVQALLPMNQAFLFLKNEPPMGAARITIQKWYRPKGDSIQRRGVRPDIVFPSPNDALPFGEADSERALPWDSISAAPWENWGKNAPSAVSDQLVDELRLRFSERKSNAEWKLLEERVEHFTAKVNQKSFSLLPNERRRQRDEDHATRASMEARAKVLAQHSFPFRDVLLDAADGESAKNPSAPDLFAGEDDALRDFDIPLRESLRILADWIGSMGDGKGGFRREMAFSAKNP